MMSLPILEVRTRLDARDGNRWSAVPLKGRDLGEATEQMAQSSPGRYAAGTHPIEVPDVPPPAARRGAVGKAEWLIVATRLLRRVPLAFLGLFVGATAGYGLARVLPPIYEASATLLVHQPKVYEASQPSLPVNVTNFRALLTTNVLASKIISDYQLDQPPHELAVRTFLTNVLSVDEVRGSNLFRVVVRLSDPQLASKVANTLATEGVELNRRLNQEETVSIRDYIKAQLDDARERLGQTERTLLAAKETAQVELRRKDADALLEQRGELPGLLVEIEGERARLARAEAQIATQQQFLTSRRSFDRDVALLEGARAVAPGAPLTGLQLQDQSLNPVWTVVAEAAAKSRTQLSALEHQRDELTNGLKLGAKELPQLSQLYRHEIAVSRLDTEHELVKKIYSDLAMRYEQARIQVASNSAQLQLVDPALPPERPISPRRGRLTLVGGLLGFLLLAGVLVLWELTRTFRSASPVSS